MKKIFRQGPNRKTFPAVDFSSKARYNETAVNLSRVSRKDGNGRPSMTADTTPPRKSDP